MKKRVTASELEQLILSEIAASGKCPKETTVRIKSDLKGKWEVVLDAKASADPGCVRRTAAIEARLRVAFDLDEAKEGLRAVKSDEPISRL